MKISKTMFKEYSRCPRVCALDDIYMKKLNTNISPFSDDQYFDIVEILHTMFDQDSGEDLINVSDPQHEVLLPYYQKLEDIAMGVAKKLFGEGIIHNINTKLQKSFNYFDNLNHELYCYLDGFQETENIVRVFEVKATTSKKFKELGSKGFSIFETSNNIMKITEEPEMSDDKFIKNYQKLFDRFSKCGKYVYDLAIERYIIEKSCKQFHLYQNKKFKYYLVVLNSDYVFNGSSLYEPDDSGNEIVTFIDLTDCTFQYLNEIKFEHRKIQKHLEDLNASPVDIGQFCERNKKTCCAFFNICWENVLKKGSILEYLGNHHGFVDELGGKHSIYELINKGHYRLDSVPKTWLKRINNVIQRDCFDNDIEYLHFGKIIRGIDFLQYPLYYLDFETFNSPLPRYRGEKPYQQSVFQFSLHIEKKPNICDFDQDHYDFIANDFTDHRLELVESLINKIDLSNGGTVIVYNKNFEVSRLKEFITLFPQYQEQLQKIIDHIFDLLYLVNNNKDFYKELGFDFDDASKFNYYHNDLEGSYSIKKVLPLFSDLSYQTLQVKNGIDAITLYASFNNMLPEEQNDAIENLRKYCKQDTWAMKVILQGLKKKVGII